MIPYGRQTLSAEDIAGVVEVLKSDWLTQGPVAATFEDSLAQYCGAAGAVAVNSGTAALHIACLALGLGAGDRLWTSPISFVASANCGRYCGAEVDFVDIDPATANICPQALEAKLRLAAAQKRLPKMLVAVHMAGNPCDMAVLRNLADRYGVRIVEDASHALGAEYRGSKVGACRYSDITVFSFHPVKIVTTGEGGAALSNDPVLLRRMRVVREHGIVKDCVERDVVDGVKPGVKNTVESIAVNRIDGDEDSAGYVGVPGDWYYEQRALGWNYRLSDIHAALGVSQMRRCDEFVARRNVVAECYRERLASLPCTPLKVTPDSRCSFHLFVVQVEPEQRRALFDFLRGRGVGVQVHYIPIHTQPYYRRLGFRWGDFPQAELYYRRALSLPVFPGLMEGEQVSVIETLEGFWR